MKLGNIATGDDFYGRETECADLWRYLEKDHVVASGPRRLGKSSILNRMCEQAAAQALQARLSDVPVLIFIDEFSVFLQKLLQQDQKQAEALLAWLRAWRVLPGGACRFLFTGSIGLNALLESYGLSAQVNDCYEYPIGPFKRPIAISMVRKFALADGWAIAEETVSQLCDCVGWLSPYYLLLLLDQTILTARDRLDESQILPLKELTLADVEGAYERLLSSRSRFIHWEQRLARDLRGVDLAFAMLILTALAKKVDGLTHKQLHTRLSKLEPDIDARAGRLQIILGKLQEEGYLSPPDADARLKFLSFLLRDYWSRNHV